MSEDVTEEDLRAFLQPDETARELFARVLADRLLTGVPFIDRAGLRPGHVLEVAGSSSTGKTEILLQAVVACILPKAIGDVQCGGAEGSVLFFDLDCKFDILRLVHVLQYCLQGTTGAHDPGLIDHLVKESLKRFHLIQCHSTYMFLASLKLIHPQLTSMVVTHGSGCLRLVCIDSIGAFNWLDRASCTSYSSTGSRKPFLSMQGLASAVVLELQRLVQRYRPLVIASKSATWRKEGASGDQAGPAGTHRDYMPAAWRDFVSHRVHLRVVTSGPRADNSVPCGNQDTEAVGPVVEVSWDKPSRDHVEDFCITSGSIKPWPP